MLVSYGPIWDSSVSVVTEVHAGLLEAADFSLPQGILTGCVASPSSATVRNMCSYTSITQYTFKTWCWIKHRNNFIFTLSPNVYHQSFLAETCSWSSKQYKYTYLAIKKQKI